MNDVPAPDALPASGLPAPGLPAPGLHVLGRVAVVGDDGRVTAQAGHAATMLALLAMEAGRVVSFDRLVEQIWGDDPPRAVRSTVYAHVSRLRTLLRGTAFGVEARAPGYVLTGPRDGVDAHRLAEVVATCEEAAGREAWLDVLAAAEPAIEQWQDPFGGATVRDDLAHEVKRLDQLAERARELVVQALLETGRVEVAARRAGELVRRDPFNESFWRLRMRAEHATGRTAAAVQTYAELRAFLADELGIDPSAASRTLHVEILRAADGGEDEPAVPAGAAPAPAGAVPAAAAVAAERPVARDAELAVLDAALAAALSGSGRLVLVEGDPGMGKTHLAEHVADAAVAAGARVVWSRAIEGAGTPPLWVWETVLRTLRHDAGSAEPADLRPGADGDDPDQARFRVHERIAAEVVAAADRRPLVLVLDDVHWADEGTVQALQVLTTHLRGHRCLVVATARPRTGWRVDPLAATAHDAQVVRLWLEPFAVADVEQLVRSWRERSGPPAGTAPARSATELHERTGGSPYLLTEVLRDGGHERVPASVAALVGRRLAEVPAPVRTVLEHAAVAGRRVDPPILSRALGVGVADVVSRLEPLRAEGLVVADQATRTLGFAHDLAREAVVERIPAAEVLEIHARLADAIASVHADDVAGHLDELADHRYRASGGAPSLAAYERCMAAADQAAAVHAYDRAAVHRQRALEMLAPGSGHRDMRFEVLFELAAERRLAGDVIGASQSLSQALEVARLVGDHVLLRRALALLGDVTMWNWRHFGQVDREAVASLEDALAHDDVVPRSQAMPPAERARILGTLAVELYYGDERARSEAYAVESAALARTLDDPALLGRSLNNLVIASWFPDRDDVRRAALDESLDLADRGLPVATETIARLHRAPLRLQAADVTGFLEDLARAEWLAARLGRPELEAQVASQWTGYHALRGDLGTARETLHRTHAILSATSIWGAEWIRSMSELAIARIEGTLGDVVGVLVDRARADDHVYRWPALLALALAGDHHDARLLQARWGLTSPPRRTYWGSHVEWAQATEVSLLLGSPDLAACAAQLESLRDPLVLVGTALAVWGPVDVLRARVAAAGGDDVAAAAHRATATAVTARVAAALGTEPAWPLAAPSLVSEL
jgi:DNA-binding SARP family transcriptional activator